VQITITDECGIEVFDNDHNTGTPQGYSALFGRQAPYSGTVSCTQPTIAYATGTAVPLSGTVNIEFPHPGKYKIFKKICVSDAPLADYTETYLKTSCGIDKCKIFASLLNASNFSGCVSQTCLDCFTAVNNHTAVATPTAVFQNQGPLNGGLNPGGLNGEGNPYSGNGTSPVIYTQTLTPQALSKAYEDCSVYCKADDRCSHYLQMMEADFYPGTGQFASTNTASPTWSLSIFNPTNTLPSTLPVFGVPTWSNTSLTYSNANSQTDYVQISGVNKHPYQLTQAEFITYFRKSWAKAFMGCHPEACKYFFYCTIMGEAIDYDEKLMAITHADEACQYGGFWFPVRYPSYSPYKPVGSCTLSTLGVDPIISHNSNSVTAFHTAIHNFTTALTQNFRNTGMDIYQFCAMQIYTVVGTTTVFTGDYLGKEICRTDDDWSVFKQYYLSAKDVLYDELLTVYLGSPALFGGGSLACATLEPQFTSHFPAPVGALDNEFPATSGTLSSTFYTMALNFPGTNTLAIMNYSNAINQFTNQVVPSSTYAVSQCSTACNSYTAGWHTNLLQLCPGYSAVVSSTQAAIMAAMVEICKLGCDYSTYLLGSSTTPSNSPYALPGTSQTVSTFQDVLDHYIPSTCSNINLYLTNPPPYPASPGFHELTSCKCDIILEVADEYSGLTSPAFFEWELFKQKYGFDVQDYYKLKCACQNAVATSGGYWTPGFAWGNTELSALNSYTLKVDDQLLCRSCLSCTDVAQALENLSFPITNTLYPNLPDNIIHEPLNQTFVANSLNAMFGLHTLQTYLDLYKDCKSFTNTATAYTFSNSITQQAADLFSYLAGSVGSSNLLNTHIMTFCSDDAFYLSSLYSGTLPIIPGYTYTPVQNSNSLTIFISQSSTTLASILLIKPSGNWSDFRKFSNFVAYCPPPLVAGPNYKFMIEATDHNYAVKTLTGAVTCTAWPISYLSSGTITVPSFCPGEALPLKNACVVNLIKAAKNHAQIEYDKKAAAISASFQAAYKSHCLSSLKEVFTRSFNGADEYSHTLYYYDQAGNLQRTVPPNGADPNILTALTTALASTITLYPAYSNSNAVNLSFVNDYQYDSYNQLVQEKTVDGGKTIYYYDKAGRLRASQNAEQLASSPGGAKYFSYTYYDAFGRISETGKALVPNATTSYLLQYSEGTMYNYIFSSAQSTLTEVTRIYYDRATTTPSVLAAFTGNSQNYLRNRVAYVLYMDIYSSNSYSYDQGTYYSYDDHGNVTELVQHNKQLDVFNQGFRNITYDFELISGNMLTATYQRNKPDQFIHKYYYDEDNRLKEVFTSKDRVNWDRDAKYFYYEHGPLARVERADKKVQGTDYLYTIHGWIKAINSDALNRGSDGGKDGTTGLGSYSRVHKWMAGDAMAFSLNYYNTSTTSDYKAIKTYTPGDLNPLMSVDGFSVNTNPFYLDNNSLLLAGDGPDLFNGNIGSMNTVFIDKDPSNSITNNSAFPQLTAYRYDQLQRLTKMKSFRSFAAGTPSWNPGSSGNYDAAYKMDLSYDNNGNIMSLVRNGASSLIVSGSPLTMDDLSYSYYNSSVVSSSMSVAIPLNYNSNKLRCIRDAVSVGNYGSDIDDYACSSYAYNVTSSTSAVGQTRYGYDAIGNLIYDKGEHIALIEWTIDRKVKKIIRETGSTLPDIEYAYNPQRQRVMKLVKPKEATGTHTLTPQQDWTYTYYIYDASGNVMGTYNRTAENISGNNYRDKLRLEEQAIYGSSRLALARPSNTFASWTYTFNTSTGRSVPTVSATTNYTITASGFKTERRLGFKDFELTNHLGNVITTVSDRKIASVNTLTNISTFNFNPGSSVPAQMITVNMPLSISATGSLVCQIQNGGFSAVNPNIATALSTANSYQVEYDFHPGTVNLSDALYIIMYNYDPITSALMTSSSYYCDGSFVPAAGHYSFAFTPLFSGPNIITAIAFNTSGVSTHSFSIDNLKIGVTSAAGSVASYSADITSNTDYYPFGQTMPGRTWVGGDRYRYDFNGKESDKEVSSGFQDYGFRVNDTRIGRFFSVDPQAIS